MATLREPFGPIAAAASRRTGLDEVTELTILMPCLNEARTLPDCIQKAQAFLERAGVVGEVLVADNGSDDGPPDVAAALGARVVAIPTKGYGAALIGGIAAARGRFVIMGDSDGSYDFGALDEFLTSLRQGWQLVMGNRFAGGITPGAMPSLHRYLGNPVLSALGRLLFTSRCRDFHCGLRGFAREAVLGLDLQAPGMEFASEMVVKATVQGLRITEVPTRLLPDRRDRPPHLRSWQDGWRHLRFLLLFSPRGLFLFPGAALFCIGLVLLLRLTVGPIVIGRVVLDIHTMLYAAAAMNLGWQSIVFWACAKLHGLLEGIVPDDPAFRAALDWFSLERTLLASLLMLLAGLGLCSYAITEWGGSGFHNLDPGSTMRLVIPSAMLTLLAAQTAFGASFLSVLRIRRSNRSPTPGPE
jgi:glycosyltransferase involved in cell wall biosynthesis